ncbi:hypothetical protein ILUMI_05288 [Ignelater luminosus]|uniref:G-patch domain-containing protein n=1 Tax=Ignelater luminosus TaxID=2038154 RepID=A0A8K0GK83_IGNLU|nr:hypothetical protein ILUMI_05288 [Ignelater luminosus]
MSRKATIDVFQTKTTRNDRFAQMSHQEKVIEQKKREIQARLEQKQKGSNTASTTSESKTTNSVSSSKQNKSPAKVDSKNYNQFSNDGSFLDQFKQLKDKKLDQKLKSFRSSQDRSYSDDRSSKSSRWSHRRRSPSPKNKIKVSRFSDKHPSSEPKINISTSYSNLISQANFNVQPQMQPQITISTQNVIGQPLLKNDIPPPGIAFPTPAHSAASVIAAPPVMLSVPPPQVIQQPVSGTLVAPPPTLTTTAILTSVSNAPPNLPPPNIITSLIPPPVSAVPIQNTIGPTVSLPNTVGLLSSCAPTLELASIPPPNPIQIQNIPQPEPINTHNIPPPAPLQVQNIPPPSPIQLNEIPNPKPMDVINIPTPGDGTCVEKNMSDPDFIKSIPPPNKSVPPPSLQDTTINVNITVPPPNAIHPTSLPPPQNVVAPQNISVQNILPSPNIVVHSVPPPQILSTSGIQPLPPTVQNVTLVSQVQSATVQNLPTAIPPPPPPPQTALTPVSTISVALTVQNSATVGVITPASTPNVIPSLLAQPVLPPPGMNVTALPVNIHCPPPVVLTPTSAPSLQPLPPSFVNQPPPITSQLPPVNVPPPTSTPIGTSSLAVQPFKDLNAGTPEYEAMASLGRMVAQCGPGIEDVVRQRKLQDPNLWFLFHKESAAYQQYIQLVEQFKAEMGKSEVKEENYKPEDIYEPEMATDDDFDRLNNFVNIKQEMLASPIKCNLTAENEEESQNRRKRKSRWGEKDCSVPPPTVVMASPPSLTVPPQISLIPNIQATGPVMLSKITRNDPALIQYALNTYGTTNLSEEDWKKAEDNFKINLVYQEMLRKREEVAQLAKVGKNKYEYDSDEDTDGGTWEHKLRNKEMTATQQWATELTKNAEGKHHIGDFLPPEELKRFMERSTAVKEGRQPDFSDYKDFKLKEDNVGFKMLQKLGWSEGQGLGANASGIIEPVNKAAVRDQNQGLGLSNPGNIENNDDEYDAYRKRMMLAYRFRPNPLNNPRRPYY